LGLDGRAEPLSNGDGRRGVAQRIVEKRIRFGVEGAYQEDEQTRESKM
jgi:hypothetical protein